MQQRPTSGSSSRLSLGSACLRWRPHFHRSRPPKAAVVPALVHLAAKTRRDCGTEGTEPLADDSGPRGGGRREFWQAYWEPGMAISGRWAVRTSALSLRDRVEGQRDDLFKSGADQ